MHVPQSIQVWTKSPHFVRATWTPAKEHVADHLICSCIGVMHIVDMYASHNHNQVSWSLLRDNPLTHCRRIHSALSKISQVSHISKVSKKSATGVSPCRGSSLTWFKRFCPGIIFRCLFTMNPATHTFFHLLKVLMLRCRILLASCFKENSVWSKLIRVVPSASP